MSRYPGGGGGGGSSSRRPAYQTSSSSSARNYASTGASERDYARSHLSGNGSSNSGANYYTSSSSSRKPESASTGYSYLEPNWIEKTRSTLPIDPYGASNYLDRAPLAPSRDYTTAATAQPVYPSAAAAALSVGAYAANSSMPKAYARPDDYYRAAPSAAAAAHAALAAHPSPYGYGVASAFEQSTMAAQAAAIYEMQHAKREAAWPPASHLVDYGRREDDRRVSGGGERRREEGRREERRRDDRMAVVELPWREREREVPRERDHRRPPPPSRERDRDLRVTVSSSTRRGGDDHREVRRAEHPAHPAAAPAARGSRHDHPRDHDLRESRDVPRRSVDKRAAPVEPRQFDRESRELERQLARVQRELEQLESGGRPRASRERESDRSTSRRVPPPSSSAVRRSPPPRNSIRSKPAAAPPPRRSLATAPSRSSAAAAAVASSSYYRSHRSSAASAGGRPPIRPTIRPSRPTGRNARQSAVLPSLLDAVVPRPGARRPLATRRTGAWEAPARRGVAPRPLVTRRVPTFATGKRGGGAMAKTSTLRGREPPTLSSREKVRRAKEKLRREEERRKRNEKKREERSKESREKRKEEDFAWLETIMSEDEELDEETNRKLLLAPRQRLVMAIVDRSAVQPNTLESMDEMMDGGDAETEPVLWTAEEADAIELLPIIDQSVKDEVAAAFLAAHPDPAPKKAADSNGNGGMEE